MKNSIVLDQSEGVFPGFSRKEFPLQAVEIYEQLNEALEKGNKTALISLLSIPMQDCFNQNFKEHQLKMPFIIYDTVLKAKLRQGTLE